MPAGTPTGVEVARLGKRIYRDELRAHDLDESGRQRYWIYGTDPDFHDEPGTDLSAVAAGRISVTPLHLDLTQHDGIGPLSMHDLSRLLKPASEDVGP